MSVEIKISGINSNSNEYNDAIDLKEIFTNSLNKYKDIKGQIYIKSNATLFGQKIKDIDLIVIGFLDNCILKIKTKAKIASSEIKELLYRDVHIYSFCFVIETKHHTINDIELHGNEMMVKYNSKFSNASTQSENQKYSLISYFNELLNISPYVCNFIWLKNVSWDTLRDLLYPIKETHNILPNHFSIEFLLQLACIQKIPEYKDNEFKFSSIKSNRLERKEELFKILDFFENIRHAQGQLTRNKIELITSKLLDRQQYAKAIGDKLIIVSGRAGTGKTIKLLRISYDLAVQKGARCLILTYNNALVSDIKRILALAGMPDGLENRTVQIQTIHKYIYLLLSDFSLLNKGKEYLANYNYYIDMLHEYIISGAIHKEDISELIIKYSEQLSWDYLLIDEAQDWSKKEKEIIFRIFGKEHIIVADGIDQLVRSQYKCNWSEGLRTELEFQKIFEKKALRQKVNLVKFVNQYARLLDLNWELQPKSEFLGGKVIISVQKYNKDFHDTLYKHSLDDGNRAYEMMFLVPPLLVEKKNVGTEVRSKFILKEEFEKQGIKIWDGTQTDLRTEYAVDIEQHRVLQYDSCRGLEGWIVVCLLFDEFVKYKHDKLRKDYDNEKDHSNLLLESKEERVNRQTNLWSLIPLTRSIDTIVITLKDSQSKTYKILHEIYLNNKDFIEWRE